MATVLIVDDEQPIVDLLSEVVSDTGHTPITANNGRDALALAQACQPDLIVSDMMMPLMDGYELLQALRSDPTFSKTIVILISAAVSASQVPVNATAFISKPLDLQMIENFLHQLPSS